MTWQIEPYTYRKKRSGMLFFSYYEILFEDTPIRVCSDLEWVTETVQLLNCAWNLGYASGAHKIAGIYNGFDINETEEAATKRKALAQKWLEELR